MSPREVAITGMGLITPLGEGVEVNWKRLRALETGIGYHPKEGQPDFTHYFGQIGPLAPPRDMPGKLQSQMRFLNRGSLLGLNAAREAVSQSGIDLGGISPERRALYIASGDFTGVGYDFMYQATKDGTDGRWEQMDYEKLNTSTMSKVNPFFLLESIMNNLFSFLSAYFGFMGPNTSIASLSPCGAHALELACRSIEQAEADVALAAACGNWITDIPLFEMDGLGILSKCRQGVRSFRPLDRARDGFIPAEGGAALFLESLECATKRGARVLAVIKGFGNCIEMPTGQSIAVPEKATASSIKMALEEASCDPADLALILPHGSGTPKGDRSELRSITDVLASRRSAVPISGLKPYTGHMAAASDLAEVIFGTLAVATGMAPATLNFSESEEEFRDLEISGSHQPARGRSFLSTSYGILGQASSVVVEARAV